MPCRHKYAFWSFESVEAVVKNAKSFSPLSLSISLPTVEGSLWTGTACRSYGTQSKTMTDIQIKWNVHILETTHTHTYVFVNIRYLTISVAVFSPQLGVGGRAFQQSTLLVGCVTEEEWAQRKTTLDATRELERGLASGQRRHCCDALVIEDR